MRRSATSPEFNRLYKPVPRYVQPKEISLSLDDIINVTDGERRVYSAKSRREMITVAQLNLNERNKSQESRPNTSASRYLHTFRKDTLTPKSTRSAPLPSRNSSRQDFDVRDELESRCGSVYTSSPAPFCCEIMGPQVCNECSRIKRQQTQQYANDASFSTLRLTNENITACAILQHYMPHLSKEEIQDKIARGDIARNRFLKLYLGDVPVYGSERDRQRTASAKAEKRAESASKSMAKWQDMSQMYFLNIKDLNTKISSGKRDKSIGFTNETNTVAKWKRMVSKTAEPMFPSFISPKNATETKEPEYKTYFSPPLVPKTKQIFEPPFFAGSSQSYSLPDRLPDEIKFAPSKNQPSRRTSQQADVDLLCIVEEEEEEED